MNPISSRPTLNKSSTLARITGWLPLLCTALLAGPALAQSTTLSFAPPTVVASPQVANAGVARTLTVSGIWPDACPPQNATLTPPISGDTTVSIKLIPPQTFVACAQVLTGFTTSVNYTPTTAGTQRVIVTVNDGRFFTSGQLVTQEPGKARSGTDLTGTWSNNTTNGSGLALFHSHAGSDAMAGAWYVYDTAGKPFWYLIQNGFWADANIFYADLVQSTAGNGACVVLPACARPMQGATRVGSVRIEVQDANRIRVSIGSGGPPLPEVNFESVFIAERLQF